MLEEEDINNTLKYKSLKKSIILILKNHLIILTSDSESTRLRKICFRKYLRWFLEFRASLHIIQG